MTRHRWKAFAAACAISAVTTGIAQAADARADRIDIRYIPPSEPQLEAIAHYVKQAQALEKVQALLKPLKLPRRLLIEMRGCKGESNAWYDENVVTICYEFMDDIWKNVPQETTAAGVAPIDAMVGPFADVAFHEVGHAIFDLLKIPVLGREEDAADQVSVYLALKFPKEQARRLILGNAYQYKPDMDGHKLPLSLEHFANEHGTPAQRFFNVLCWAYGSDPKLFADVVAKGYLPKERAEGCEDEYRQMVYAFDTLIRPHIDEKEAKKLYATTWLPPVTKRPPPRKTAQ